MLHIKTGKGNAEMVKKLLVKLNIFDRHNSVQQDKNFVYFPVNINNNDKLNIKKLLEKNGSKIIDMPGLENRNNTDRTSFDALRKKINTNSYDVLGNIAIVEIREPGIKKEEITDFANHIMKINKSIKTILMKEGPVEGIYRIRKVGYIAGKKTYIARYIENHCLFTFDVRKTFFSVRLSYERTRIMKQVKEGENIVVMFAGIGPFAIEIAKAKPHTDIIAIEINPYAYKQMVYNIKINKTGNVIPILGDVKKVYIKFKGFADRIVMPLPKISTDFLDEVLFVAKDECIVHLYSFVDIDNFDSVIDKIKKHAKENGYKVVILFKRKVRGYSVKEEEIVIDYKIIKHKR